jgi:2-oxoglutarate ferredoxin oxidoreductase subunit alpha
MASSSPEPSSPNPPRSRATTCPTLPDFPAEIRAPAGTLAGVSGFQIHFSASDVRTPADQPDVLVAFNPAALRANIEDVRPGGTVILNSDAFNKKSLQRAGYESDDDPLEALRDRFQVVEIPITALNREAVKDLAIGAREGDRSKNFFALGLMYWLYNRPIESTIRWLESRFKGEVLEANVRVLKAGYAFGETTELFPRSYIIPRAKIQPGTYRNITGNTALAWGIVAAGVQMDRPIFLGAYPITPASDVLHEVARFRHFGVKTFQAEDEIAAISATIGASFAGHLAVTTHERPGMVLKQEALGLAVMTELPLVVVDIQRSGPSTGMPTKIEQGDLLLVLHGRNSESPLPVLAPCTPGDCFYTMLEAFRIAVRHMTPVVVLSDSYLANSAEPWLIPNLESLTRVNVRYRTEAEGFQPYQRDPETLARAVGDPGHAGSRAPDRRTLEAGEHGQRLIRPAEQRAHDRVARGEDRAHRERAAARRGERRRPRRSARGGLGRHLRRNRIGGGVGARRRPRGVGDPPAPPQPVPGEPGRVLGRFDQVLVPELNAGQLALLLRAKFLIDIKSLSKIQGQPFKVQEIRTRIDELLRAREA